MRVSAADVTWDTVLWCCHNLRGVANGTVDRFIEEYQHRVILPRILDEVGDLEVALNKNQQFEKFLALPATGVCMLLRHPAVKVAYESTVFTAITQLLNQQVQ